MKPADTLNDDQVILQYLAGETDAALIRHLENRLDDPQFRQQLALSATDEAQLHALGQSRSLSAGRPAGKIGAAEFQPVIGVIRVIAAILILACGAGVWLAFQKNTKDIAVLSASHGQVLIFDSGPSHQAGTGTSLQNGKTIRTMDPESSAQVSFPDGSLLRIGGDSHLSIADNGQKIITLGQGRVAASVQPQPGGHPMIISTPHARLSVLGTELAVSSGSDQTTVSVTHGRVQLNTPEGRALELNTGQFVRFRSGLADPTVQLLPVAPAVFDQRFDSGLPDQWHRGVWVTRDLPPDSRGAVRAVPVPGGPRGTHHQIVTHTEWNRGLFALQSGQYLNVRFRFDKNPGFFHFIIAARSLDPAQPGMMNLDANHGWRNRAAGKWYTLSVPFSAFRKVTQGPLIDHAVACTLLIDSQENDRGLTVDRLWITDHPVE